MIKLASVSAIALAAAVPAMAQQTTGTTGTTTTAPSATTQTTTRSQTSTTATPTQTTGNSRATVGAQTPVGTVDGSTTVTTGTTTTAPATGQTATTTTGATGTTTEAANTPNPTVGGAAMAATSNIVQNASAAPNLTTLVSLVTAADLAATLSGPGPFTVFAPTNDAFGRVAQVTRDALGKPEAKPQLQRVLKYHVVPGTLTLADLKTTAAAGGTLTTVEGQTLTVKAVAAAGGEAIELTDANGNKSYVEVPDVRQSNGVVHVVNGVLFPKLS